MGADGFHGATHVLYSFTQKDELSHIIMYIDIYSVSSLFTITYQNTCKNGSLYMFFLHLYKIIYQPRIFGDQLGIILMEIQFIKL